MAVHVVKGNDGERVYLNDEEYKKYKNDRFKNGCLVIIIVIIIAVWVALSDRHKSDGKDNLHDDEQPVETVPRNDK